MPPTTSSCRASPWPTWARTTSGSMTPGGKGPDRRRRTFLADGPEKPAPDLIRGGHPLFAKGLPSGLTRGVMRHQWKPRLRVRCPFDAKIEAYTDAQGFGEIRPDAVIEPAWKDQHPTGYGLIGDLPYRPRHELRYRTRRHARSRPRILKEDVSGFFGGAHIIDAAQERIGMTVDGARRQFAVHHGPACGQFQTGLAGIDPIGASDFRDIVVKDGYELLQLGTTMQLIRAVPPQHD